MLEQISLQFGTSQGTPNFYHPTAINLLSKRKPWTFFESIKYILLEFPLSHKAVGYTVHSTQKEKFVFALQYSSFIHDLELVLHSTTCSRYSGSGESGSVTASIVRMPSPIQMYSSSDVSSDPASHQSQVSPDGKQYNLENWIICFEVFIL